ncbi:MAG TPA: (5-formylfuran-3-yl)methyl phosphate synthase [Lacipirellulaceae bacterium]|nr:(5-formylfuran-3-yl)methyl phosphate synthase [Lacipirellulaceae bacterium]HMP05166.1 (5-formylfuran-3-yl)methyl phosphate synthase [Lacipirellulaceae bacterium]
MPAPPALLVSVRDADEARAALAGGAQWIDLKEPRRGALGPVDAATARGVAATLGGAVPLSAAAGELRDWPLGPASALASIDGIGLLKIGLAGGAAFDWRERLRGAATQLTAVGRQAAAVVYADFAAAQAPPPDDVVAFAAQAGCSWVLWDTCDKSGGSTLELLGREQLADQLRAARAQRLHTAVGGRITHETIDELPLQWISLVAVRGAACEGGRTAAVSPRLVAHLRARLERSGAAQIAGKTVLCSGYSAPHP